MRRYALIYTITHMQFSSWVAVGSRASLWVSATVKALDSRLGALPVTGKADKSCSVLTSVDVPPKRLVGHGRARSRATTVSKQVAVTTGSPAFVAVASIPPRNAPRSTVTDATTWRPSTAQYCCCESKSTPAKGQDDASTARVAVGSWSNRSCDDML